MTISLERWMALGQPSAMAVELFNNFGGQLTTDLTASNHTVLVPAEVQFVRHNLVGGLTQDRTYTFPAMGGFYFIYNLTTGGHTTTINVAGGVSGVDTVVGDFIIVFVDPLTLTVLAISGGGSGGQVIGTDGNVVSVTTTPYTIQPADGTLLVDATVGPITIVLPNPVLFPLRQIAVDKVDATANTVTISGTINNGSAGFALFAQGQSVLLRPQAASWWLF